MIPDKILGSKDHLEYKDIDGNTDSSRPVSLATITHSSNYNPAIEKNTFWAINIG